MKTFADLKEGDKIYYWDHGKLHEQIVYVVKKTEKVDEWKDWYGKIQKNVYDVWIIKAGQGTTLEFWHTAERTIDRCGGMTRFSCIEAAQEWLNENAKRYYARAEKYKKRFEKAYACAVRYDNADNNIRVSRVW